MSKKTLNSECCSASRADGSPCGARARPGGRLCLFHDPRCKSARDAGRRAGGQRRCQPRATVPVESYAMELRSVEDVCELLSGTIRDVRTGRLDPKLANTVGYLASVLVRALEVGRLEERLAALELVLGAGADRLESSFHREP